MTGLWETGPRYAAPTAAGRHCWFNEFIFCVRMRTAAATQVRLLLCRSIMWHRSSLALCVDPVSYFVTTEVVSLG